MAAETRSIGVMMRRGLGVILVVFLLQSANSASLSKTYFEQHVTGWHWYHETHDNKVTMKKIRPVSESDPVEQMKSLKKIMKRSLDKAILSPTPQNVSRYIYLQNALSQRATQFAKMWQRVLLMSPEMNYSLQQPTEHLARLRYHSKYREKEDKIIRDFFLNHGLLYFYRASCPYCRQFSPVIKDFVMRQSISLIPVTVDGHRLPEFPETRFDNGQAKQLNIHFYPALLVVEPRTKKIVPLSFGFISQAALRARIVDVATQFAGHV